MTKRGHIIVLHDPTDESDIYFVGAVRNVERELDNAHEGNPDLEIVYQIEYENFKISNRIGIKFAELFDSNKRFINLKWYEFESVNDIKNGIKMADNILCSDDGEEFGEQFGDEDEDDEDEDDEGEGDEFAD